MYSSTIANNLMHIKHASLVLITVCVEFRLLAGANNGESHGQRTIDWKPNDTGIYGEYWWLAGLGGTNNPKPP